MIFNIFKKKKKKEIPSWNSVIPTGVMHSIVPKTYTAKTVAWDEHLFNNIITVE